MDSAGPVGGPAERGADAVRPRRSRKLHGASLPCASTPPGARVPLMASETSNAAFDLKLHIRRIRAELEARGIWIDDELDDGMMEMMRLGRGGSGAGGGALTGLWGKKGAAGVPRRRRDA